MKERYGYLELSREEWKQSLASRTGLFAPVKGSSSPGPHVRSSGEVQGDVMAMELFTFNKNARPEQHDFFDALMKTNKPAAFEYVLTLIGALPQWKQDMLHIRGILVLLQQEEALLIDDDKVIKDEVGRLDKGLRLIEALERHAPELMQDLVLERNDLEGLLSRLREREGHLSSIIANLASYLQEKERQLPFLFE